MVYNCIKIVPKTLSIEFTQFRNAWIVVMSRDEHKYKKTHTHA